MVLWCGLKLATGWVGFGASWEVQAKVSCCMCSVGTTWCELRSDVQIAVCDGLGGGWERLSCELRLAAASAVLGDA